MVRAFLRRCPFRYRLALVWLLVAVFVGCAHGMEEADQAIDAGEIERAEQIIDDELADAPDSPWANQLKAELLVDRGDYREALGYAETADQADAFPVRTPRLLGEIHAELGRPVDAADALARAREHDPDSVDIDFYVETLADGLSYARVRTDHESRWRLANRLRDIDADHPEAAGEEFATIRRAYAVELRQQGDYFDAVELLESALDDDPEHLRSEALDLGEIYARLEMPDDAQRAWNYYLDAADDEPELIQRHFDVAEQAADHGLFGVAIDTLNDLPERATPPERRGDLLEKARYQLRDDRPVDARRTIDIYLDELTADTDSGDASITPYRKTADLAMDHGETRLAITILEDAVEQARPSRDLTWRLADIYARRAQLDNVEEVMNLFVDRSTDDVEAATAVGEWASERNNYELARTFYERATDADDVPNRVWLSLADVLGHLDERTAMTRAVDTYLDRRGLDSGGLSAAELYTEFEMYDEAEHLLTQLRDQNPESRLIARQLAGLYRDWSRPGDAADVWSDWASARGDDPDDLESIARILARARDHQRASQFYRRAAEAGNVDAWLRAADIHLRQDHPTAMAEALESYLDDHPDRSQALEEAASRYRRADMEAHHLDAITELVERHPGRWDYHEELTRTLLDQGRRTEAFDHLHRYVDLSDDPATALEQISDPMASTHPPRWLLEFYQNWVDDPRVQPVITRLIGDAYYEMAEHGGLSERRRDHLRRRARDHYLDYLEATEEDDEDWRRLANQWRRNEMWRPAAIAFRRHADGRDADAPSIGYAETMLHLGEIDRATELLERHFQSRQRRPEVGARIAELLIEFGLFDRAAEYAGYLMMTGEDGNITTGFQLMAEIYEQREEYHRISELVDEFIERVANTSRARRSVVTLLDDMGQWEVVAEQLADFDLSMLHQLALEMGFQHYRSGDIDRALRAFEEAASHASQPEQAWLSAAEFLAARGEVDHAADAYDLAVQANPDSPDVRIGRARFLIHRNDLDSAWEDYEFARGSRQQLTTSRRVELFDALADAGRFEHARRIVDHFREDDLALPNELQTARGHWDLRNPDPTIRDAGLDLLRAGTWSIHEMMTYLDDVGHRDLIYELIDDEFQHGDATTGAYLLLNRMTPVAQFAGWDRKSEWLGAVVDPLERSDERLLGPVGDRLAHAGRFDDALLYLQASVDEADSTYRGQLGQTLLLRGESRRAFEQFESLLLEADEPEEILESILLRFEIAGASDDAMRFLDRVAQEPALIDVTLPYRVHYELEYHGDPDRAIDDLTATIASLEKLESTAFQSPHADGGPSASRGDMLDNALVASLQAIAALGYVDAVRRRLDDVTAHQPHRLDELRLRLAIAEDDLDGADELVDQMLDDLDGIRERQRFRLRTARTFISFGIDGPARRLVDDTLGEQTDFRTHEPFVLKLGMEIIAGADDLSSMIDDYIERVPNRHHARMTLIDELHRMGRDAEALRLAERGSQLRPTPDFLRRALRGAIDHGDPQLVAEYTDRMFAVSEEPIGDIRQVINSRMAGTEAELLLPVVEKIRQIRPADLYWTVEHARILYADGQIPEARSLIVDALEERDFHRDAVTDVVRMLDEQNLDVELSRIVAPAVGDDALWPELLIAFAEADLALGFHDDAHQWLDRLDDLATYPAAWRLELAGRLADRALFEAIEPVIAPIDDAHDTGPFLDFARGLHRLADGEPERGLDDIRRAGKGGIDRNHTHFRAIRAALVGDHPDAAVELMGELADVPIRDYQVVSWPLQTLLAAAMDMPGGPAAIREYLEQRRPRLVDGHGATWTQFTGQLARAFEFTDDPEGAYGFYRDRIWKAQFHEGQTPLPTYLNNLAYTYSTTDHNLDRGLDKIRRAIVLRDQRSPSFIDTLGWLLYRQGDLEGAEREIRRALRSYDGPPSGLDELLKHLQIILHERGIYDRAAWIDTHRNRLPPRGMGW